MNTCHTRGPGEWAVPPWVEGLGSVGRPSQPGNNVKKHFSRLIGNRPACLGVQHLRNWGPINSPLQSLQSQASVGIEGLIKKTHVGLSGFAAVAAETSGACLSFLWSGQTPYPRPSFPCLLFPSTFRTRVSKNIKASYIVAKLTIYC